MTCMYYPVGPLQANCWMVWDEARRAAVIDPGEEAPRLLRAVRENCLSVQVILLTHAHVDHRNAVHALQTATGAPLMLDAADAPALTDMQLNLAALFGTQSVPLTADRLLYDGNVITAGDLSFTVLHTPGHTPGSCCYRCGDTLFTGDTLFAGSAGRTDFPGGDFASLQASLRRLASLPEDLTVNPGHGQATTLFQEKRSNPFMIGF